MKALLVICLAFAPVLAEDFQLLQEARALWPLHKMEYNLTYETPAEDAKRFRIFSENFVMVQKHNELYIKGESTYEMGMNQYSTLTDAEFNMQNAGVGPEGLDQEMLDELSKDAMPWEEPQNVDFTLRTNFDWRKYKNVVTPVKNQGACGSCWSFAAASTAEGQVGLKHKEMIPLSEQQLVDCVPRSAHCNACNGGWPPSALRYLKQRHIGWESEETYPYVSDKTRRRGRCRYNAKEAVTDILSYEEAPRRNWRKLATMLQQRGPIAIYMNANNAIKHYKRGIFNGWCPGNTINHAVTLVGMGQAGGRNYWTVRNSWGARWGEKGYFRIARDGRDLCGITSKGGVIPRVS